MSVARALWIASRTQGMRFDWVLRSMIAREIRARGSPAPRRPTTSSAGRPGHHGCRSRSRGRLLHDQPVLGRNSRGSSGRGGAVSEQPSERRSVPWRLGRRRRRLGAATADDAQQSDQHVETGNAAPPRTWRRAATWRARRARTSSAERALEQRSTRSGDAGGRPGTWGPGRRSEDRMTNLHREVFR